MVNTSTRPITVDGVRLDSLAWNITRVDRATASRRSGDYDIPNLDGVVPSLNDPLEPSTFGLEMLVMGTDADGAVPVAGRQDTFRANLDELLHLFGQRHKLLELREQVTSGAERRAWVKVTDSISPEANTPGQAGTFTVAMAIPAGQWEDPNSADWASVAPTTVPLRTQEVTTLQGATDRINDGIFVMVGPATTPRITDPATGMYVELGMALTAGQAWRFNSASWSSRYGATGTVNIGSTDADGTDATAVTGVGGPSRAYGLPLTPIRDTGARRVTVVMAGTGFTAATQLLIRARKKYAA